MRSVQQSTSIVVFAAGLLLSARIAAQPQPAFPDPSGPFEVGRLEIDVTDASRDEVFTGEPTDKRRLLVSVYYPAKVRVGEQHTLYGTPELAAAWPFFFNEARRGWLAPGYTSVPIADGRFPVLVFSPGLGNLTLHYSSLLYEIASRGFVVAALWHPYNTERVVFPDGTVLESNPAGNLIGSADEQWAKLERLSAVWVADQRFVLDQLVIWNEQHVSLRNHLDLQRVGAFGHSLGGAASVQAAHIDERIDAAVNMDGAMFGTATTEGSRVPFLLIEAEIPVLSDADLEQAGMTREQVNARIAAVLDTRKTMLARSRNASAQKLELSKHNTFMTDFLFFTSMPAPRRTGLIGDVEPTVAFATVSTWIADFMEEHVARPAAE